MQAKHKSFKSDVNYSTQIVGERGESKYAAKINTSAVNEQATWKQVNCLVRMGYKADWARTLTKRRASAIISKGKRQEQERMNDATDQDSEELH